MPGGAYFHSWKLFTNDVDQSSTTPGDEGLALKTLVTSKTNGVPNVKDWCFTNVSSGANIAHPNTSPMRDHMGTYVKHKCETSSGSCGFSKVYFMGKLARSLMYSMIGRAVIKPK